MQTFNADGSRTFPPRQLPSPPGPIPPPLIIKIFWSRGIARGRGEIPGGVFGVWGVGFCDVLKPMQTSTVFTLGSGCPSYFYSLAFFTLY